MAGTEHYGAVRGQQSQPDLRAFEPLRFSSIHPPQQQAHPVAPQSSKESAGRGQFPQDLRPPSSQGAPNWQPQPAQHGSRHGVHVRSSAAAAAMDTSRFGYGQQAYSSAPGAAPHGYEYQPAAAARSRPMTAYSAEAPTTQAGAVRHRPSTGANISSYTGEPHFQRRNGVVFAASVCDTFVDSHGIDNAAEPTQKARASVKEYYFCFGAGFGACLYARRPCTDRSRYIYLCCGASWLPQRPTMPRCRRGLPDTSRSAPVVVTPTQKISVSPQPKAASKAGPCMPPVR